MTLLKGIDASRIGVIVLRNNVDLGSSKFSFVIKDEGRIVEASVKGEVKPHECKTIVVPVEFIGYVGLDENQAEHKILAPKLLRP